MIALHYAKTALPHLWTFLTFGGVEQLPSWKARVTVWLLSAFWVVDLPVVLLSFGKVSGVYHGIAGDLWFETDLYGLSLGDDGVWAKTLWANLSEVIAAAPS